MTTHAFTLVYENDYFIVINKSTNINFHDEGEINQGVFNQVKASLGYTNLFPVHRIDKITSGLLIFAKDIATANQFGLLFKQHNIDKYYLAISADKPRKKQGWIKGDMVKSRRSSYKLMRSMNNPALSQFHSYPIKPNLRLFLVRPLTGKTHQIRVALKSVGAAIVGDPIYNPQSSADRGYLHAYGLRFELNHQQYEFICPPNQGAMFELTQTQQVIESLPKPWLINWPKK
ncbi:TIGR01621 family pseudouridine synthase [Thalassotalea aquiviva]|uniref:TIGR01621 family pseudouridine synthase n=1 Tax=Thalassotalea aquiviva TaxID=3242415 RepID=UPI00352AE77D